MTGSLFSDRYGSNLPSATNGRAEKLLRYGSIDPDKEINLRKILIIFLPIN